MLPMHDKPARLARPKEVRIGWACMADALVIVCRQSLQGAPRGYLLLLGQVTGEGDAIVKLVADCLQQLR